MKRTLIGIMLTVLLATLSSCELASTPPPSTQNPILYPGAQQIVVKKTYGGGTNTQRVTYQTQASPEVIAKFYQTELRKDEWDYLVDLSSPTYLDYQWASKRNPNISAFGLLVVMTSTTQITLVDLMLSETVPH